MHQRPDSARHEKAAPLRRLRHALHAAIAQQAATMVSSEVTRAAYYLYGRHLNGRNGHGSAEQELVQIGGGR